MMAIECKMHYAKEKKRQSRKNLVFASKGHLCGKSYRIGFRSRFGLSFHQKLAGQRGILDDF